MKRVLQVGLPAGVQESVFSVSNIFVQAGVNSFGAQAIAGAAAGLNFEYFTYDICAAFAQAAQGGREARDGFAAIGKAQHGLMAELRRAFFIGHVEAFERQREERCIGQ